MAKYLDDTGVQTLWNKCKDTFGTVKTVNNASPDANGNVTVGVSGGNSDTVDGYHASSFAKIAEHNDLTASGNEFTFASSGFSGDIYLNYRTAGGPNGNITGYILGNGKGGNLGTIIHTGNIGSYVPSITRKYLHNVVIDINTNISSGGQINLIFASTESSEFSGNCNNLFKHLYNQGWSSSDNWMTVSGKWGSSYIVTRIYFNSAGSYYCYGYQYNTNTKIYISGGNGSDHTILKDKVTALT